MTDGVADYAMFKVVCPVTSSYIGIGTTFLKKHYMKFTTDAFGYTYFSLGVYVSPHNLS